ncbi:MAG: hypothetical protein IKO38_07140 [Erysipelotrichaceae bacterium]|nr:hypothetical protein [Erysipelotrichaceae bacterium]
MAQTSLNVYTDLSQETKDNLAEILGGVVENIQTSAVSEAIKNKKGSGDPEAGVINYKRFVNAQLKSKGTARTAGKGTPVQDANVPVNLNDDKEIVEELQKKDIKLLGVDGLAEKRKGNFSKRIAAYLDTKFFGVAKTEGTAYDGDSTAAKAIVDDMIVTAKNTSSNFIDGIDADDLCIVLDGTFRKAVKNALDQLPNGTKASNGQIGVYDGIDVYESNRLPSGVHCFVMLKEAIAEPWYVSDYDVEKIPFDDAIALENFLYCGCKALNPEAIYYYAESGSATV